MLRILHAAAAIFCLAILSACSASSSSSVENLLDDARSAIAANKLQHAKVQAMRAVREAPDNATARVVFGEVLLQMHEFPLAEITIRKAIELDANPDASYRMLAESLLAQGKNAELLGYAYPSALSAETQVALLSYKAEALLNTGRLLDAQSAIQQAKKFDPDSAYPIEPLARLLAAVGRVQDAESLLRTALKRDPDQYRLWLSLGKLRYSQADYGAAAEAFDKAKALAYVPGIETLYRALTALHLGETEQAEKLYNELQRLYAKNPIVNYVGGALAYSKGDFAEAENRLDQALAVSASHLPTLYLAAAAHAHTGAEATAQAYLSKLEAQVPPDMNKHVAILSAFIALSSGDASLAKTRLDVADSADSSYLASLSVTAHGQDASAIDPLPLRFALAFEDSTKRTGSKQETGLDEVSGSDEWSAAKRQVQEALKTGDLETASKVASDYTVAYPKEPRAYMLAGLVALARQDFMAAEQAYRKALGIDASYVPALKSLAALKLRSNDPAGAAEIYRQVVKVNPDDYSAYLAVAAAEKAAGNSSETIAWLQRAVDIRPDSAEPVLLLARALVSDEQAPQAYKLMAARRDQFSENPEFLVLLARLALQQDDEEAALSAYSKLTTLLPNDALLASAHAKLLGRAGKTEEMEQELRRTLSLAPESVETRIALATHLLEGKRLDEAEAVLRQHKTFDSDGRLLTLMALIMRSKGSPDEAIGYAERAFAVARNNRNLISLVNLEWEKGNKQQVFDRLKVWLDEYPDDLLSINYLADRYLVEEQYPEAEGLYRRSLAINPQQPGVLNNLAWLLRERDPALAREYALRAQKLAPDNPRIRETLESIPESTASATR